MIARMTALLTGLALVAGLTATTACGSRKSDMTRPDTPSASLPEPMREFRAAWVATVANIDWPSRPNLTVEEQQAEAIHILDEAVKMNLNAIVFQARPAADALYQSDIEPWSYYLTGEQGKAPEPFYDPLEFWVKESHDRGIELHVWFNPYRAHHPSMRGEISDKSIVKTRPDIVKFLSRGYWWMDPAEQDVQDISIDVVMDVVRRYDIDGVHFDDYFYPYLDYNDGNDFPDDDSWQRYVASGGTMERGDWRRNAVNVFIERLYREIKAEKPHVKFGMSPFGIFRPGYPPGIQGFDQYAVLYADARLWWNEGWVDYYTPQLYWPIAQVPQSFPILLRWWADENTHNRNLWPGVGTYRTLGNNAKPTREVVNEVMVSRALVPEGPGQVHFSMKSLMNQTNDVRQLLVEGPYAQPALVPASPWLGTNAPRAPRVTAEREGDELLIAWETVGRVPSFRWVVSTEQNGRWTSRILNRVDNDLRVATTAETSRTETSGQGLETHEVRDRARVKRVAVAGVDRLGNMGAPTIIAVTD